MKNVLRWIGVLLVPLLVLALLPHAAPAMGHVGTLHHVATLGLGAVMLSQFVPVVPRTQEELKFKSVPQNIGTNGVRFPYYDTQTFTSGAANNVLTYFQNINADKTLSNVKGNGGILPNGYWFEPLWLNIDILSRASLAGASTQVGIADDIQQLLWLGRGIVLINYGTIKYPELPMSYCHTSGGAIGSIGVSLTVPNAVQFANNGAQDSGYCMANTFIFAPNTPLIVQIQFSSTVVTLNNGNTGIRVSFDGNWYQPVM